MKDTRINWTLPAQPLGESNRAKLERLETERKDRVPAKVRSFHKLIWDWAKLDGVVYDVEEADTKQIKGAAQAPRSESVRGAEAASRADTTGDSAAKAICSPEVAPPSAAPVFKVGDRVLCKLDSTIYQLTGRVESGMYQGEWNCFDVSDGGIGIVADDEIELAPPEAASGSGWIEWKGGESVDGPNLPEGARVVVRFQNGEESEEHETRAWDWGYWDGSFSIRAYRIVSQP